MKTLEQALAALAKAEKLYVESAVRPAAMSVPRNAKELANLNHHRVLLCNQARRYFRQYVGILHTYPDIEKPLSDVLQSVTPNPV